MRVLGFLLAALLLVPTVEAHANFHHGVPPPGARLAATPQEVVVVLTQDIDPRGSDLRVQDSSGHRIDHDDLRVLEGPQPRLSVTLPADLPEGVYRVEWKALSRVDHHTSRGTYAFAIGNHTAPLGEAESQAAPVWVELMGRGVFYVGFFLAAAGAVFALWVLPNPRVALLRRSQWAGWTLVSAGSAVLLVDATARAGLVGSAILGSDVGRELAARAAWAFVGLVAVVATVRRPVVQAVAAGVGLTVMAWFSSMSGHASTGVGSTMVDVVHLLAVSTWVGGLLLFALLLRRSPTLAEESPDLPRVGGRFAAIALVCVLTMAVSGVMLATMILGWGRPVGPLEWFQGIYGSALLGKILLAIIMVGLAAVNRYVFLPKLRAPSNDPARPRRLLARFVGVEATIGIVVLLLASLLTASSPPHDAVQPRLVVEGQGEEFRVRLVASPPPAAGSYVDLRVHVTWMEDNSSVEENTCGRVEGCIVVEIVQPGAEEHEEDDSDVHEGGEHRILEPLGNGWWIARGVLFVEPGDYRLLVEIQTGRVFLDVVALVVPVEGHEGHEWHAA